MRREHSDQKGNQLAKKKICSRQESRLREAVLSAFHSLILLLHILTHCERRETPSFLSITPSWTLSCSGSKSSAQRWWLWWKRRWKEWGSCVCERRERMKQREWAKQKERRKGSEWNDLLLRSLCSLLSLVRIRKIVYDCRTQTYKTFSS